MPRSEGKSGFGLEGIGEFEPAGRAEERPRLEPKIQREMERMGEEEGFVKRGRTMPIRVRRERSGPASINVRVEVEEFNRFVRMAQDARMGRADFLVALMDAYEELKAKNPNLFA